MDEWIDSRSGYRFVTSSAGFPVFVGCVPRHAHRLIAWLCSQPVIMGSVETKRLLND